MTLRNCSKCYRKLNPMEIELFGDVSSDILMKILNLDKKVASSGT